jgi:hypothetical protein
VSIKGLADEGLYNSLTADVQLSCSLIEQQQAKFDGFQEEFNN